LFGEYFCFMRLGVAEPAEVGHIAFLKSVGPNATLVADDFEKVIRSLKSELAGEIHVAGPVLAQSLTEAGLIDEYQLYLRPVVLGGGTPFFAGPRPPLHLVASRSSPEIEMKSLLGAEGQC
jgi:dihydrofolate reductase